MHVAFPASRRVRLHTHVVERHEAAVLGAGVEGGGMRANLILTFTFGVLTGLAIAMVIAVYALG
jgi:hypothetical protein